MINVGCTPPLPAVSLPHIGAPLEVVGRLQGDKRWWVHEDTLLDSSAFSYRLTHLYYSYGEIGLG